MGGIFEHEPETALLTGTGELANDYEIQHILSVASAYLEAGRLEDAEELLFEAQDANAQHPGVKALAQKLAHVHGTHLFDEADLEPVVFPDPDVLVHFTVPLPGIDAHPPAVQRLVRATEQYYGSGRIYSALDLTQILCAEQSDYIPAFVRLAELQIELGMVDQAGEIYASLKRYYDLIEEPAPWLVESLRISLDPGDTSALIGYAVTLIEAGEATALDPFVPEAIARAVDMNVDAALNLAESYLQMKPNDSEAQRLYLKVVQESGDQQRFVQATRTMVPDDAPLDLSLLRLSAEIVAEDAAWIDQLERVVALVRKDEGSHSDLQAEIESLQLQERSRSTISRAAILQAAGEWQASLEVLQDTAIGELDQLVERFIHLYLEALALTGLNHPEAQQAMVAAAQVAYHPDVEPFARATSLFGVSADPVEILQSFAVSDDGDLSVEALTGLRDANPERMDIRLALADAHLRANDVFPALKELRFVADAEERAGNMAGMIDAMQRMSRAVPTNIEIKAKLIDGYMRRGILDEAVVELEKIGELYLQRDRVADAVATFTRAAEIATALGKFDRGNSLFERAVEADPDNVPVRHAAVAHFLQTGSVAEATQQLREVVRIAIDAEDRDEAVAALHQIIALAPQDPGAYHKLGEVLTSLGEYTQAERVYRRLASFSPHDPVLEAKQSALAVLAATR